MKEWIPTTDRLPDYYISVLVYVPDEHPLIAVKEAYLANGAFHTKSWIYHIHEIPHWMPMPDAPKEV